MNPPGKLKDPLDSLENLLKEEFKVLSSGDFGRLAALLCEKTALIESLQGKSLDPRRLKRCRRLNRELLQGLSAHTSWSAYQR